MFLMFVYRVTACGPRFSAFNLHAATIPVPARLLVTRDLVGTNTGFVGTGLLFSSRDYQILTRSIGLIHKVIVEVLAIQIGRAHV